MSPRRSIWQRCASCSAARATSRVGFSEDAVRDKLKTLDNIYRFAVDQTAMDRGELLEIAVVAILVVALVLFFLGHRLPLARRGILCCPA